MAVKLDILANVKGTGKVNSLNKSVNNLGKEATIAATRMKSLEAAAVRGRASFGLLATTLQTGVVAGFAAVGFAASKFVKDTFEAGKLVQSLEVRFKLLFDSVEEGNKAFDQLNKFASKVPFSLEAIAQGSGNLAVISEDAEQLGKIMEVTGNVAAATGLDFRQTAEQIQRSFAGGIAAADVFRERGVRAMLGFEAGAKVSVEETKKRFFEVFANGGQYSRATKDFEKTLEAQVSFVQDAYFRFRQAAAQPLFEGVTKQVKALVGDFKQNDEQLKRLAKTVGESLAEGFKNFGDFVKFVFNNFDNLVKIIKSLIAIKLTSIVGGMAAAMVTLALQIKTASKQMGLFNAITRANPIGLLVTAVQGLAIAWIYFGDTIKNIVLKNFIKLNIKIREVYINILEFIGLLNKVPGVNIDVASNIDEQLAKIVDLRKEIYEISLEQNTNSEERIGKLEQEYKLHEGLLTIKQQEAAQELAAKLELEKAEQRAHEQKLRNATVMNTSELSNFRNKIASRALVEEQQKMSDLIIGFEKGIEQSTNAALDYTKNYQQFSSNVFDGITDKIADFVQTGKLNFKDLANDFISQIIRMETKALAARFLQNFGGGASGGAGGFLSGIIGGGFGGGFLGFNKGGIVPGGAPYKDRVPAMLTPGEMVIPRNKVNEMNAGGNRPVITNINISGNVDQRAIDQIKAVIVQSTSEVGSANRAYQQNTNGLKSRNN